MNSWNCLEIMIYNWVLWVIQPYGILLPEFSVCIFALVCKFLVISTLFHLIILTYLNVIIINRNNICLKLIAMLLLLCFLLTDSLSAVATATASTTDSCTGNVVWAIACFQSKISFIPREGTLGLRKENCSMKLSI